MADHVLNLKLVGEIEKHPCLYNYTLTDYSRKDKTQKAWNEVGQVVNLSATECKERWKNLRAVFVRHMKPSPSSSYAKLRKPYYLANEMQFAVPFIKALHYNIADTLPMISTQVQQGTDSDYEDSTSAVPDDFHEEKPNISNSLPPHSPEPETHPLLPQSPQTVPPNQSLNHLTKKKIKRPQEDECEKAFADYLRAKKKKMEEVNDPQQEANKMFLLSLLPDMNRMSPKQVRTFKKKVFDSIDEIIESTSNASN